MLHLQVVLLACVLAFSSAESEVEPAAAASPPIFHKSAHHDDVYRDSHHDRLRDHDEDDHEHRYRYGPRQESRLPHGYTSKERKIIENVFSPDYAEPTVILDYRYLKSGGRKYVRGPGGQILILPKDAHVDEHAAHNDYDSLIEHLRIRNLARLHRQEDVGYNRRPDAHRNHEEPWY